jgi:hypothetical protein
VFQDYILDAPELSKYEIEILREFLSFYILNSEKSHAIQTLKELIDSHPSMSKREKTESKLIKLILD